MSDGKFRVVKFLDPIVVQTNGVNASISGNTDGTPAVVSSGTMILAGGNNITLSQSQNTISIHGGAGAGGGIANSAGTQLATSGTVKFANSNGITFGMSNSSQITASHNGLTTARASNDAIGLNTAVTNATLTANSSGFSFDGGAYLTTAQPVGAYLTTARASNDAVGLNTAQTNVTWTVNSSGISLNAGAYLTTAALSNHSHGNPTLALTNLTGTTASASNGLTLSLSGNAAQTVQTQNLHNMTLSGNTAGAMAHISSGTLTLAGGNNITLSQNGNAVTISGGAAGAADGVNALVVNGGASTASTTLALSNSNNVTFGHNAGTITASASFPTQTNQTIGIYGSSQTTGQSSSSTYDARSLTFRGAGIVSVGNSGGEVIISATGGGAADGGVGLSAGANSVSNGTVVFSNSNGLSFGLNGSTVTASHNGLTSQSNQAVSAGNGSSAFQTLSLVDAGGLTWSTVAGGLQASVKTDYLTSQSNQAFSAQGGSSAFQTLNFTNSNGFSFSNTNGSIWGSYTVPTVTNSSLTMQAGASTLSSVSRVHFGDSNGISFGASTSNNGSITITATVKTDYQSSNANYLTSQSNQNITAANGGFAFQTLSFSNLNGISFGTSAGSAITASHNALTTARASNDAIGLNTAQSNVTWTANSSGLSLDARGYAGTGTTFNGANLSGSITQNSNGINLSLSAAAPGGGAAVTVSASNGSFTVGNLNFSNANNVTFGTSAGSIVTASVAAPGAAAENNWFNLLGANTAGNTTASGSTIGLSGINLTLSGTNGSAMNISAPATSSLSATGGVSLSTNGSTISIGAPAPVTYSRYNEFKESPLVAGNIGQGSLHLQPWLIPNLQFDRVVLHKAFSNATNSSNSFTVSDWVGIYTKNGSTLSLLQSTSISTNFSGSGTAGSYLSYAGGIKAHTIGMTNTLTEGMYWIGVIQRTTTGGGAGHTLDQALNSNLNSSYRGLMGAATNASNQMSTGFGVYSATTSSMPDSVAITQILGNSSVYLRPPSLYFVSGTV